MAIKREYTGNANQMSAGEHRVVISELKMGKSKSEKPMLTITFKNDDDQTVKGYFVIGLPFVQKQLKDLKVACGLDPNADGMLLNGKRCGIALEEGKPDANGVSFMKIVGFGKESEVEASAQEESVPPPTDADQIPF